MSIATYKCKGTGLKYLNNSKTYNFYNLIE